MLTADPGASPALSRETAKYHKCAGQAPPLSEDGDDARSEVYPDQESRSSDIPVPKNLGVLNGKTRVEIDDVGGGCPPEEREDTSSEDDSSEDEHFNASVSIVVILCGRWRRPTLRRGVLAPAGHRL